MEKEVKYTIRLPEKIHEEIEKSAKLNRRSLNNEMLTIFDQFIAESKRVANEKAENDLLTQEESNLLDKIKNLPLDERKAMITKMLSNCD